MKDFKNFNERKKKSKKKIQNVKTNKENIIDNAKQIIDDHTFFAFDIGEKVNKAQIIEKAYMATVTKSSKTIFDEGEGKDETNEKMDKVSKMSFNEQIGNYKFSPKESVKYKMNKTPMRYKEKQKQEHKENDQMIGNLAIAMPNIFNNIGNTISSLVRNSNLENMNLTNTIK